MSLTLIDSDKALLVNKHPKAYLVFSKQEVAKLKKPSGIPVKPWLLPWGIYWQMIASEVLL